MRNKGTNKKITLWTIVAFFGVVASYFLQVPNEVQAAEDITVTPIIIDEQGYARDIIDTQIVIKNNKGHKIHVHAFVQNIDPDSGLKEFENLYGGDRAQSLANWIEVQRSVIEIGPQETKVVPVRINVSNHAEPGKYHALIGFGIGSSVDTAKERGYKAEVTVNMEVLEDVKEFMNILSFRPDKVFFTGFPVEFEYDIENTGNTDLRPEGEIIIYNRRGKEVDAIGINQEGALVAQAGEESFNDEWTPGKDSGSSLLASASSTLGGFGRYKAVLHIEYGEKVQRSAQDTIFFWVVPIYVILGMFLTLSGLIILIVRRLHKRAYVQ